MCLFNYCNRSLKCPISTLIAGTRCTVWHDRRIRVVKSLSYLSEPIGGENFPQRTNFLSDLWLFSHPYINSFFFLSALYFFSYFLTSPSSSDLPIPSLFSRSCLFRFFPPLSRLAFLASSPSLCTHLTSLVSPLKPVRRSNMGPPNPRWPCRHVSCCGNSWCGSSSRSRSGGSSWGSRPCSTRRPAWPRRPPLASASRLACPLSLRCRWRCWRWAGVAGVCVGRHSRRVDMKQRTDESKFFLSMCQFSSGIRRHVCHCCSLVEVALYL